MLNISLLRVSEITSSLGEEFVWNFENEAGREKLDSIHKARKHREHRRMSFEHGDTGTEGR